MKFDKADWIVISTCLAVVIGAFLLMVWSDSMNSRCLVYGYPDRKTPITSLETYCIKRVDNTDIVVKLSDLEEGD